MASALAMSGADATSNSAAATTQNNSVMLPHGSVKAAAIAPKLSDSGHVELEEMLPSGPDATPAEDIMQLARIGDIQGIEKLYSTGKYDALYCDAEGITPLHVPRPAQSQLATLVLISGSGRRLTTNMLCVSSS